MCVCLSVNNHVCRRINSNLLRPLLSRQLLHQLFNLYCRCLEMIVKVRVDKRLCVYGGHSKCECLWCVFMCVSKCVSTSVSERVF